MCRGRQIRGVWLAGWRHAPHGQAAGVSWHHSSITLTLDTYTPRHTHTSVYATANSHTLLSHLNTPFHSVSSHTHMMGCGKSTLKTDRSLTLIYSHAGFQEHSYFSKTSAAIAPYSPVLQTSFGSARYIHCQSLKLSQCRQESTFMLLWNVQAWSFTVG